MRKVIDDILDALGSYALATILLLLLLVLTFVGTLEQAHSTLYDVQEDYFRSLYVIHYLWGWLPLPLPGGYLLLPLLVVNLIVGVVMRMWRRRSLAKIGVYIVHFGVVFLFAGSFVEDLMATKGVMRIWEAPQVGESPVGTNTFESPHENEVVIVRHEPDGSRAEFVIPGSEFTGLGEGERKRCTSADLPFDVVLYDPMRNARLTGDLDRPETLVLTPRPRFKVGDRGPGNIAGLRAAIVDRATGRALTGLGWADGRPEHTEVAHRGVLWAGREDTFVRRLGERTFSLALRPRLRELPFTIQLDEFVVETHPGTNVSRRFSSYVTITETEGGEATQRRVHITMNEPLRLGGFALYQHDWGPKTPTRERPMYSVFQVVNNPSDKVPLWATVVITLGLLVHFGRMLVRYLAREAKKRAPAGEAS